MVKFEPDGQFYKKDTPILQQLQEDVLLAMDISLWPHIMKLLKTEEIAQTQGLVQQEVKSNASTMRVQAKQTTKKRDSEDTTTMPTEDSTTNSFLGAHEEANS